MSITFTASADVPAGTDVLGIPVSSALEPHPGAPVGIDRAFLQARRFTGKVGEVLAWPAPSGPAPTVLAVGAGDTDKLTSETARRMAAAVVRGGWEAGRAAIFVGTPPSGMTVAALGQAAAEGAFLASYQFSRYKGSVTPCRLSEVAIVGTDVDALAKGAERGTVVARAVALARDLVNEPAGAMTPRRLAEVAAEVAGRSGLQATVWDEERIVSEGLGGLAGVARGSDEPARLVQLAYEPDAGDGSRLGDHPVPTVALVGKGITFDSGGLSIKSADGMMTMKTDMSGAAVVLATMSVLETLGVAVRVLGFLPVTENMPGGRAIKPGDVLTIRNGKTIEVLNTDAEGRLVLADGLSLAVEAGADAIVDLATLTGACVVALGRQIAGLMGNHEGLLSQVQAASERAGELTWLLPLPEEYRKHVESEVADMKNIGAPGQAGALSAGLILSEFVGEVPWAHLDIAGPARSDVDEGYLRKGGTGYGVRTLIEMLSGFQTPSPKMAQVSR